ncbi:lachesin-like [Amphibalanus amphitrite]|uniref:lachesin-like n=1 Tax=Amphibalanus amphitrite TaxID=1232801 RepID=UPI001C90BBD7|nr:lachesin-like [Amphibalanus amphitrite]
MACVLVLSALVLLGVRDGVGSTECRRERLPSSALYTGPYFDATMPTNVTAQLGTHAFLPCIIQQLDDKSVSWVRNRDSHILTVDRYTFIADERFQCFHVDNSETWTLQIKYVQTRDAGLYECQISTEPKICHIVTLNVIVPRVAIVGGERDLHVNAGSTVTIQCVISRSIEQPAFVFWHHDGRLVMSPAGGRHRTAVERTGADTTVSTLVISRVRRADSGNYTCQPSNLPHATVLLHVLNGEHHAAMQDGVSAGHPAGHPGHLWLLCVGLSLLGAITDALVTQPRPARGVDVT